MNYVYMKINNLKYKGFDLYYRTEINTTAEQATVFNDKYEYFYKSLYSDTIKELGKFKVMSKRSSNLRYNDYDYDVYEFTNDYISCDEKKNIYCRGIAETGDNMVQLEDMLYLDLHPIYYNQVRDL
jgi:hypothetical protein